MTQEFRVVYVSRDRYDLHIGRTVKAAVEAHLSQVRVKVVCGDLRPMDCPDAPDIHYIYDNVSDIREKCYSLSDFEITRELAKRRDYAPVSLYRADQQFLRNLRPARHLAIEQIQCIDHACKLIADFKPHALFTTGGQQRSVIAIF